MEGRVLSITTGFCCHNFYTFKKCVLKLTRISDEEETEVYIVTGRAKPKQCKTLVLKHFY